MISAHQKMCGFYAVNSQWAHMTSCSKINIQKAGQWQKIYLLRKKNENEIIFNQQMKILLIKIFIKRYPYANLK